MGRFKEETFYPYYEGLYVTPNLIYYTYVKDPNPSRVSSESKLRINVI